VRVDLKGGSEEEGRNNEAGRNERAGERKASTPTRGHQRVGGKQFSLRSRAASPRITLPPLMTTGDTHARCPAFIF